MGQRVVGGQVEIGVNPAEHEIEIEQDRFMFLVRPERGSQIDGHRGAADTAGCAP